MLSAKSNFDINKRLTLQIVTNFKTFAESKTSLGCELQFHVFSSRHWLPVLSCLSITGENLQHELDRRRSDLHCRQVECKKGKVFLCRESNPGKFHRKNSERKLKHLVSFSLCDQ
jgi:hypothetical protein